jgi:hypothetical protein
MSGMTSWFGDRIASLVPNLLPTVTANAASSCWYECGGGLQYHCCQNCIPGFGCVTGCTRTGLCCNPTHPCYV